MEHNAGRLPVWRLDLQIGNKLYFPHRFVSDVQPRKGLVTSLILKSSGGVLGT